MEFEEIMEIAVRIFEGLGVAAIILGGAFALIRSASDRPGTESFFVHARRNFGRPMILGLEILVAADIVETITVDPSLEAAATLGILVLVRIVLSFSLDVEIDGVVPWRHAQLEAAEGT